MHVQTGTALIVTALVASILLLTQRGDRVFPGLAVLAAGIEALIAFELMSISIARFRLDLILSGLLVVAGAICWSRTSTKSAVSAATVVTVVGLIQLLGALDVLR